MQTRHDIYALVHKAMRLAMSETLISVGRVDASDPMDVSDAIVRVRDLLHLCTHHLEIENDFIHPALESRRPGSTSRIAADHVEHSLRITALARKLEALAFAPVAIRDAAAFDLYGDLAAFVGENFVHMHEEETMHNRELWAAYTDAELVGLERSIKQRHTPDEMKFLLRWMLPAMSPAERCALLREVRGAAPVHVYEGIVALAKTCVDPVGLRKLDLALAA